VHLGSVERDDRCSVGLLVQQGLELDLTDLLLVIVAIRDRRQGYATAQPA
jgi:hypothetical protein